jgi:ribosomal protein L32
MAFDILTVGEDLGNEVAENAAGLLKSSPHRICMTLQYFRVGEGLQRCHGGWRAAQLFNLNVAYECGVGQGEHKVCLSYQTHGQVN